MTQLDTGQILSAIFLGIIVLLLVLSLGGRRLQRTLQQAAIWALIFVSTIAAFGIWGDIQGQYAPKQAAFADQGRVEVPRHPDGHYYIRLTVNGAPIDFVVDTGASEIVLTQADAVKAGLKLDELQYFGRANTANGQVRTAPVRLAEVNIGGIRDENVSGFVNEGQMEQSLLGMTYLNRWDRIEISDGMLVLSRD